MTREQLKVKEDNWKFRRVAVFGTLGSMLAMTGYLTVFADGDNAVQSMLAQSLPFGILGLITIYVGGPIADDWLQLRLNKS